MALGKRWIIAAIKGQRDVPIPNEDDLEREIAVTHLSGSDITIENQTGAGAPSRINLAAGETKIVKGTAVRLKMLEKGDDPHQNQNEQKGAAVGTFTDKDSSNWVVADSAPENDVDILEERITARKVLITHVFGDTVALENENGRPSQILIEEGKTVVVTARALKLRAHSGTAIGTFKLLK